MKYEKTVVRRFILQPSPFILVFRRGEAKAESLVAVPRVLSLAERSAAVPSVTDAATGADHPVPRMVFSTTTRGSRLSRKILDTKTL